MQAINENIHYSPKFHNRSTISVRRLSWFMKLPMTKVIDIIIEVLPYMFDSSRVCKSCKEKSLCKYCAFNNPNLPAEEQVRIFEAQK